jgi:hypothetical protein
MSDVKSTELSMTRRTRHQLRCQCCSLLFPALSPAALYCSDACRQAAWRARHRPTALVVQRSVFDDSNALPPARQLKPAPMPFAFEGRQVRVITDDHGMPWFVAADVCAVLGVGNSRQALTRLDDDEKGVFSIDTLGGTQSMTTVNEPGLFALVLGSRKPEARRFKRWVTHEVLPTIRRTGRYAIGAVTPQTLLPMDPQGVQVLVVANDPEEARRIWHDTLENEIAWLIQRRTTDPVRDTAAYQFVRG